MILGYCERALNSAQYKKLDDGTCFAEIQGLGGVCANAATVEACRNEIICVIEEWLVLKLRDNDSIPEIDGIGLEIREMMVA